jgi:predicted ABC-type sugar transport system permease subunit
VDGGRGHGGGSLGPRPDEDRVNRGELLALAGVLAFLVAAFSLATDRFFSIATFRTIANQVPEAVIVAVGLTFVLVIAGIDLSVGSVLALASAVLGVAMLRSGASLLVGGLLAVLTGLACGAVNGVLSVRFAIPSFIVTLGMLEIARGATYLVTRSQTQYVGARVEGLADGVVLGLSLPFLASVGLVGLGQFVLSRTVFGRYAAAIGTNEEAVRLAGMSDQFAVVRSMTGPAPGGGARLQGGPAAGRRTRAGGTRGAVRRRTSVAATPCKAQREFGEIRREGCRSAGCFHTARGAPRSAGNGRRHFA